ncbi:MAG: CPBP family intramembrane glutamic endopeptidase [Puniceicoccales bacterium]
MVAIIPFFINDFCYLFPLSYEQWVTVDYVSRLASLTFLSVFIVKKRLSADTLGLRLRDKNTLIWWTLVCVLLSFAYALASGVILTPLDGLWRLSATQYDNNSALYMVDMTLGLMLVAASEEIIFRGLALSALRPITQNSAVIIGLSSLFFAAAHWSTGIGNMLDCFVLGAVFMAITRKAKSIYPPMITHFLVDLFLLFKA